LRWFRICGLARRGMSLGMGFESLNTHTHTHTHVIHAHATHAHTTHKHSHHRERQERGRREREQGDGATVFVPEDKGLALDREEKDMADRTMAV